MNEIATILVLILWYPNGIPSSAGQFHCVLPFVVPDDDNYYEASIMFPFFEEDYEL